MHMFALFVGSLSRRLDSATLAAHTDDLVAFLQGELRDGHFEEALIVLGKLDSTALAPHSERIELSVQSMVDYKLEGAWRAGGELESLCQLSPAMLAPHAHRFVPFMTHSRVYHRTNAMKVMKALDSGTLASHVGAIRLRLQDEDSIVRRMAEELLSRL